MVLERERIFAPAKTDGTPVHHLRYSCSPLERIAQAYLHTEYLYTQHLIYMSIKYIYARSVLILRCYTLKPVLVGVAVPGT